MRNDDIAENVLQIGKEGVRQNIAEALNEFCEEFADEMWKAAEEVIKLRAENAALRERLENAVEFPFRTGQELYMIDDFKHANVWKGICNGIEVKQTRIPRRVLFYVYVAFEDPETCTLRARKFTNETLNEIYTTREVAEARLAELKGEQE